MQETHVVLAVRVNSEGSTPSSSVADSGRSLVLAWFPWGCGAIGSAPALQADGCGFESRLLHLPIGIFSCVPEQDSGEREGKLMDKEQAVAVLAKKAASEAVVNVADDYMSLDEMFMGYSLHDTVIDRIISELYSLSDSLCPYDSKIAEAVRVLSS